MKPLALPEPGFMSFPPVKDQMEAILHGTEEVITAEDLERKLERSRAEKRPLKVKQGFDPTSPDIHLGHTISIGKLRTFQEMGHQIVFLVGDFTAMIGDPSGQDVTRPRLSRDEVEQNAATYSEQIFRILDPARTQIAYNSEWHGRLSFAEVIRIASQTTVARMLERDDFSKRYAENRPIAIHEFLYPLAQGYDSVALEADVELGGTDQKFNLLLGRAMQREFGQDPQVLILMPLLVGTDGERKMSKSLGNHIGITDPPAEMYGKVMSIPDHLIGPYYRYLTALPEEKLKAVEDDLDGETVNPRDLKRRLARLIVAAQHSEEESAAAEGTFDRVFIQKDIPEEMPEHTIRSEGKSVWLPGMLKEIELVGSSSEGKRMIRQGGVYIDGERVEGEDMPIPVSGVAVIKVGKRKFARVRFTR
jgi:tyrosyl-tRNA synthetase